MRIVPYTVDAVKQLRCYEEQNASYHLAAGAFGWDVNRVKTVCQKHGITLVDAPPVRLSPSRPDKRERKTRRRRLDEPCDVTLTVAMTSRLLRRIDNEAKRQGLPRALYIRELLDQSVPAESAEAVG